MAPQTALVPSENELVLGPVAFDQSTTLTLSITNADVRRRDLVLNISGDDADAFSVDPAGAITLAPGDAMDLSVAFTPTAIGPQAADLVGTLTDHSARATSTGTATDTGTATAAELLRVSLVGLVDPDGDNDGALHEMAGGDDCDDTDPSINPSATEVWYDGIDQDCDGNDSDADGDGADGNGAGGDDCDDSDPNVYPSATEVWYDGVDQNCDGNDSDADGDGFAGDGTGKGAMDCDDTNSEIYPGAVDVLNGLDDNCNDITDEDGVVDGDIMLSELFSDKSYKTGSSDEYFELWMKVDARLDGWVLSSNSGSGTLSQLVDSPGAWVLVCSQGLAALDPDCGVSVNPWPVISRTSDSLTLSAAGNSIDQVDWDASWGLASGGLQLDVNVVKGASDSTANDSRSDWCSAPSSGGSPNSACH